MISIIDDDECVRQAIQRLVRSLGYVVTSYGSAEEFLVSHQINDTSCLITDVHLPGLSGFELHRGLRAHGFAAPTIFVSGFADDATRRKALACGAVGFLSKPFGKKSLIDCLKIALSRLSADVVRH